MLLKVFADTNGNGGDVDGKKEKIQNTFNMFTLIENYCLRQHSHYSVRQFVLLFLLTFHLVLFLNLVFMFYSFFFFIFATVHIVQYNYFACITGSFSIHRSFINDFLIVNYKFTKTKTETRKHTEKK